MTNDDLSVKQLTRVERCRPSQGFYCEAKEEAETATARGGDTKTETEIKHLYN